MKKILIFIILSLLLLLGGCDNPVKANERQITLYLEEEFLEYMKYEEVPSFTLTFEGTINTSDVDTIKSFQVNFSQNDDLKLSEILGNLIEQYQDSIEIELVAEKGNKYARINTIKDGKITPLSYLTDDGKEYYEIAYFELENGLKMTLDYRRFVSEGVNYYVWRYERSIIMWLYYPLMVIEYNGERELVLLTLPPRIVFKVGPQLKVSQLINDNRYLNDRFFYTFKYLDSLETIEEKKQYVIDYYVNKYDGYIENDKLYFTYLGVKFVVTLEDNEFYIEFYDKVK